MKTQLSSREDFDKKFSKPLLLKWCPDCGNALVPGQISVAGGTQVLTGSICKKCGYIHNPKHNVAK